MATDERHNGMTAIRWDEVETDRLRNIRVWVPVGLVEPVRLNYRRGGQPTGGEVRLDLQAVRYRVDVGVRADGSAVFTREKTIFEGLVPTPMGEERTVQSTGRLLFSLNPGLSRWCETVAWPRAIESFGFVGAATDGALGR